MVGLEGGGDIRDPWVSKYLAVWLTEAPGIDRETDGARPTVGTVRIRLTFTILITRD